MDQVSHVFETGSCSAVIGPNGAGKTTLFNLITGRLRADSGDILIDGERVNGWAPRKIARLGVVRAFQTAQIFENFTVLEALALSVSCRHESVLRLLWTFPSFDDRNSAERIISLVGLEEVRNATASELSHADQKLLDIAIALAVEPKVLLLDEPTAGLGPQERHEMMATIKSLWAEFGFTLVFIEHDMDLVFRIAEAVLVLRSGQVLADGTPDSIRRNPAVIEAYLGKHHAD